MPTPPYRRGSDCELCGTLSDEEQAQVTSWLAGIHLVLEELYLSFSFLVYKDLVPGRAHLIGHCIRELRSDLLAHIVGTESTHLDYRTAFNPIAEAWKKNPPDMTALISGSQQSQGAIPAYTESSSIPTILQLLEPLVEKHYLTSNVHTENITRLFEYFQIGEVRGGASLPKRFGWGPDDIKLTRDGVELDPRTGKPRKVFEGATEGWAVKLSAKRWISFGSCCEPRRASPPV